MFWKTTQQKLDRHEGWLWQLENQSKRINFNRINELDKKLNLILDHLNLEYVAETEKKEPAKLVEKKTNYMGKKRGRPKKK